MPAFSPNSSSTSTTYTGWKAVGPSLFAQKKVMVASMVARTEGGLGSERGAEEQGRGWDDEPSRSERKEKKRGVGVNAAHRDAPRAKGGLGGARRTAASNKTH